MIFIFLICSILDLSSSSFICPVDDGTFPDPVDCDQFYVCSNGVPYHQNCPSGLRFNGGGLYCDWPDNVECGQDDATTSSTTTTATTTTAAVETSSTTVLQDTTIPGTTKTTSTTAPTSTTTSTVSSTATTYFDSTTTTSASDSDDCHLDTDEPINEFVRDKRRVACMLPAHSVDSIGPGNPDNPDNVKNVESIFSESDYQTFFPAAHPAYSYQNFLKAFGAFPSVCETRAVCKKILANIFAHFQQETAGLYYIEEINKSEYCAQWTSWVVANYPCTPGKKYYGRGAKQLSWNYNYGMISNALYGDSSILLNNPELVADTWLNFASALWFFVTPQPPKPSMLEIVTGDWVPNGADIRGNIFPGFGATTMVINGAMECGPSPPNTSGSRNRQNYYRQYTNYFSLFIGDEKLSCDDMSPFSSSGSAHLALYWSPDQQCRLVTWQTAFSALVEGDYSKCLQSIP